MIGRLESFANLGWYHCRRSSWMVYPRRFVDDFSDVVVDRPIFLLGNQGGGLTLISRMLRRHPQCVSITGGSDYWSGADEMQRVMAPRLPPELRLAGSVLGGHPPHPCFDPPRSWSYGSDDLVEAYRLTEDDADPETAEQLRSVIAECVHRFGSEEDGRGVRFVDKSQVYTLKARYIQALLADSEPHFALITRHPYAASYRAALGKAGDMERYSDFMDFEERLDVCAQHWRNTMQTILEDRSELEHFGHWQFEQFLETPESTLADLCEFAGLEFTEELLPAEDDRIPFGSRFRDRWYPLRPEVNQSYLDDMTDRHVEMIDEYVGELAEELGYERP
ncbi:MAG: sulfotransferase [Bradymonadaceae bacterium]